MIICNSNNFAVTRAQKTGGTSLELYILESGLVDYANDIYTLEGGFNTWEEFKAYSDAHGNLKYTELPRNLWGYDSLAEAQVTFAELVERGQVAPDMPCIGAVRHPLEWLASLYYYANERRKKVAANHLRDYGRYLPEDIANAANMAEPDASFEYCFYVINETPGVITSLKPQTSYYPDHAQLFNIENIHEHVTDFITAKGGSVPERIEARKSNNDPTYYLENLSEDRKKLALEWYEKDLLAWEKAYAVYN